MSGITSKSEIAGIKYEHGNGPETIDLMQLPEKYVAVKDFAYFADSDGYVRVVEIAAFDGKNPVWAWNALTSDVEEFGENIPEGVIKAQDAIVAALTALAAI